MGELMRLVHLSTLFLALLFVSTPSMAHMLRVFASVEGDIVNVEARFSTGRLPVEGEVRVYDANEAIVATYSIDPDGVTSFPLDDSARETGLTIEVVVGNGHSDYWVLTPEDIASGQDKP